MKSNSNAFSLIELMVVIAIVAVLAVIATPAYMQYKTKAGLNSVISYSAQLSKESIMYYSKNGEFPTMVAQIGLPTGDNPNMTPYETNPADFLSPYVANVVISDMVIGPCSVFSIKVYATDFNSTGVYDGNNGDLYTFERLIFEGENGVIYDACSSFGSHYDNGLQGDINYGFSGCSEEGTGFEALDAMCS